MVHLLWFTHKQQERKSSDEIFIKGLHVVIRNLHRSVLFAVWCWAVLNRSHALAFNNKRVAKL